MMGIQHKSLGYSHFFKTIGEQRVSATGLDMQCSTFKFAYWLHVTIDMLTLIEELNLQLQQKRDTVWEVVKCICSTINGLSDLCNDGYASQLWDKVSSFCTANSIDVPHPQEVYNPRGTG
eukprot:13759767-Ditylum_brightwellii.AAC.1